MPRVQHLGMDELESAILAEGLVAVAKQVGRRERPLRADGTRDSGYSFPSGHATVTFAAATVLQQHLGYKAAIPTYIVATYVAASRLHDNVHWTSDVVMGAALGVMIGAHRDVARSQFLRLANAPPARRDRNRHDAALVVNVQAFNVQSRMLQNSLNIDH